MFGRVHFLARNQYHLCITTVILYNYSTTPVKKCCVYTAPGISLGSTFHLKSHFRVAGQTHSAMLSVLWEDEIKAVLKTQLLLYPERGHCGNCALTLIKEIII